MTCTYTHVYFNIWLYFTLKKIQYTFSDVFANFKKVDSTKKREKRGTTKEHLHYWLIKKDGRNKSKKQVKESNRKKRARLKKKKI